jgi:hypothetical protein
MYNIDSMYESMADAVVKASREQTADRWVATAACWLGRQQIFSARDFWYAIAAKVTSLLPAADKAAVEAQLSKQEDALFDSVGDWPDVPSNLQTIIDTWSPPPAEVDIDAAKAEAIIRVDRAAEAYRMNFITPGFGQVMAYQQKLVEARAKLANASIADAEIPHLVSEAEATGKTKQEVAEEIIGTFETWQALSASIEGKRMAAKTAIAAAETAEQINTATDINWAA